MDQTGHFTRHRRWLDRFGFTNDPFAIYEADQERPILPSLFVDRPYLAEIVGNPAHPQAAFLLAERGKGKSATREMVAYECSNEGRLRRRALAVRYQNFSLLLRSVQDDPSRLTVEHHVRAIVREILKVMADTVAPTYFDWLNDLERDLVWSYARQFSDDLTRRQVEARVGPERNEIRLEGLSPHETLCTLADIVARLGRSPGDTYQAVYILVDRVDETGAGAEGTKALLKPIVSDLSLLQMEHLAFKLFLPLELENWLPHSVRLRPDRLNIQIVRWTKDALRDVVERRLRHYSQDKIFRLEELCTPPAKRAQDRLIDECGGSPRVLLRLCKALIDYHVERTDETLIDWSDVLDTMHEFRHRLEMEEKQFGTPLPEPPSAAQPGSASPPATGLYLDNSGHVWVDGQQVTPPLSDLEFKLLHTLYAQAPEIVSHDELIEAVWSQSSWDESKAGLDEQNLRKLIDRLRQRLPNGRSRFVQSARGRGYWLKKT